MRICMLIWDYWPGHEGGAQRQCRKLAHALAAKGHACTVVTQWPGGSFRRVQLDGPTTVRRFGAFAPVYGLLDALRRGVRRRATSSSAQAGGAAAARKFRLMAPARWLNKCSFMMETAAWLLLRRRGFDVIHVHESHWIAGLAAWIGSRTGIPVVCKEATFPSFPAFEPDIPFAGRLDRERRRLRFLAMNEAIRGDLIEKGVSPDRVFLVPNGVEVPPDPADVGRNEATVFVGHFSQGALKAFDVLLEAWRLVVKEAPDARLLMVGGGDTSPWQAYAREHHFDRSIEFTGFAEDVAPYYERAALFVLPSRQEGLSNALLEAQSRGIPAVVSDIPGNRMVIEEGENGLIVPVADAKALARAILRLRADPALRARMGVRARERVRQRFSLETVTARLEEVYLGMLGR